MRLSRQKSDKECVMRLVLNYNASKHKTNANYGNFMSNKVEKRVAKNLLCDSCYVGHQVGLKKFYYQVGA